MTHAPEGVRRHSRRIGPLGWSLIVVVAAFLVAWLVGLYFIDRLTVHNRTTAPVSFTDGEFGFYSNDVGACESREFQWGGRGNGGREGWQPSRAAEYHGDAVEIELPVERWFEFSPPADHFFVVVTSDGVATVDPEDPLPDCEGLPPQSRPSVPDT